jgi:hypothetical protein
MLETLTILKKTSSCIKDGHRNNADTGRNDFAKADIVHSEICKRRKHFDSVGLNCVSGYAVAHQLDYYLRPSGARTSGVMQHSFFAGRRRTDSHKIHFFIKFFVAVQTRRSFVGAVSTDWIDNGRLSSIYIPQP